MRLIDADALDVVTAKVPKSMDAKSYMAGMEYVLGQIDAMPTIKERKTGKWIELDFTEAWEYRCDQCGRRSDFKENFCPNCGADMRGEKCTKT